MIERLWQFNPLEVQPGTARQVEWVFARYADEILISIPILVIAGDRPGATALILAGVHGDEYEGPSALFRLMRNLKPSDIVGRLVIVPVANTLAWRAGTRNSPIDGVNLARVFPGLCDGSYTERLAHHLFEKLAVRCDFLMDCHSGGVNTIFLPVAGFYQHSAEIADSLAAESLAMAKSAGLPHIWRLPQRAGVLSCEAMKRGVAAFGCEVGGAAGCLDEDVDRYEKAILNALRMKGMVARPSGTARDYETYLSGDWQLASVDGCVVNHVTPGQQVDKGERVATILDEFGQEREALKAPYAGVIMGIRHLRSIQAGDWATCVVEEIPLK